jgi:hypothetical protein
MIIKPVSQLISFFGVVFVVAVVVVVIIIVVVVEIIVYLAMDSRDVNVTFTKDSLQQVYIEQQQQQTKTTNNNK